MAASATKYVAWYLPTGSIVEVLWSSEHSATTAAQWTAEDPLYPLDGTHYIFPLHHDITCEYRYDTEVFVVEELPFRLNVTADDPDGLPYYTWSKTSPRTVTVHNVERGTEIVVPRRVLDREHALAARGRDGDRPPSRRW